MTEALWHHSAGELANLISTKQVSSREVVEAHLARIAEVNPSLNAVVTVLTESALAAADAADAVTAKGGPLGVFHGVPITVKDNIDVKGLPTTQAVHALANAIAPLDAPIVERMRAAGAIPIGRTNLPDMGLRLHTHSSLYGLTRNPWNAELTTGGSSGGEGSAIASGMSPLGLGNDIGGSLRNPANNCGITSLKPSTNRLPFASAVPPEDLTLAAQQMLVDGPMARRVGDLRTALGVLAGPHPRDPFTVPAPFDYPDTNAKVRVAVVADPPGGTTDPAIAALIRATADKLSNAGYAVEEIDPPRYEETCQEWSSFLNLDLSANRALLELVIGDDGNLFLSNLTPDDLPTDAASYSFLQIRRYAIARSWAAFMDDYPIVLSPTWAHKPFAAGWDIESKENSLKVLEIIRPVMPANYLGLPAVVVPAGMADGMPVGAHVQARRFREDQALAVAEVIESVVGPLTPIDPRP